MKTHMHKSIILAVIFAFTISSINAQTNCISCSNPPISQHSSAIGYLSEANADYSTAIGYEVIADGLYSIAIGDNAKTFDQRCYAIGTQAVSYGVNSLTFGNHVTAIGSSSMVIGVGAGQTENLRLKNNHSQSLMIGFNSTKPTFFVSQSLGSTLTGRVSIGDMTNPQAKLHIKADYNEDAAIRLEPQNSHLAKIEFANANNRIQAKTDSSLTFYTAKLFRFTNGDVFIEDINKGIIMKSPDGQCWRGVLDNYGSLNFTIVNCDSIISSKKEIVPKKYKASVFPNPAKDKISIEVADLSHHPIIQLFTMRGELIFSEKMTQIKIDINTSNFSPGSYVIHLIEANGNILFEQKIILM